jgi:hypothetical protein
LFWEKARREAGKEGKGSSGRKGRGKGREERDKGQDEYLSHGKGVLVAQLVIGNDELLEKELCSSFGNIIISDEQVKTKGN